MIGLKITVEYYDQNVNFEHLLPRSGRIVREVSLEDWGTGWYLLELDEPFDYNQTSDYRYRNAKPDAFKEMHVTHLLIKSGWVGCEIGSDDPTSVFVLLVPDSSVFEKNKVLGEDFLHVCWGMVNPTKSNKSFQIKGE